MICYTCSHAKTDRIIKWNKHHTKRYVSYYCEILKVGISKHFYNRRAPENCPYGPVNTDSSTK